MLLLQLMWIHKVFLVLLAGLPALSSITSNGSLRPCPLLACSSCEKVHKLHSPVWDCEECFHVDEGAGMVVVCLMLVTKTMDKTGMQMTKAFRKGIVDTFLFTLNGRTLMSH
jgi:hypothetical protein